LVLYSLRSKYAKFYIIIQKSIQFKVYN
jgi:hypothetical protein